MTGVQTCALPISTSGLWKVSYEVRRAATGNLTASSTQRLAPYAWSWDASAVAGGDYVLNATLYDFAGRTAALSTRFFLVPSGFEGLNATLRQPSLPTLPDPRSH